MPDNNDPNQVGGEGDAITSMRVGKGGEEVAAPQLAMPCPTLYIRNLNEKIKPQEIRTTLYHLASTYGEVIDIVITKYRNITRMRGQAFIVFRTTEMAQYAMNQLQNFNLFGKPIQAYFANSISDATHKLNGQYDQTMALRRRDEK